MADELRRINLYVGTLADLASVAEEGTPAIVVDGPSPYIFGVYADGAWRYDQPYDDTLATIAAAAATSYGINLLTVTSGTVRPYLGIKDRAYGSIYMSVEGVTAQSIPAGATYTKITPFDANMANPLNTTPDHTNDNITVGRAGMYVVGFTRTYLVGTANVTWHIAVFVNGVLQPQTVQSIKSSSTATQQYAAMNFLISCAANDTVDIRVRHDNPSSVNLTYEHATLYVTAQD